MRYATSLLAMLVWLGVGLSVGLTLAAEPAIERPSQQQVRGAVARSLPYLEKEGQWWINEKKCVSCHRVAFLTWTFSAAESNGFAIDGDKLRMWNEWSLQKSLNQVKNGDAIAGSRNKDGLAQMILGSLAYVDPAERRQSLEPLVSLLVKGQRADGSWKAGGQLPFQKRPKPETNQVTTMWIALALGQSGDAPEARRSRGQALQWLSSAPPGKSVEWYVGDLLLKRQNQNSEATNVAASKLRSLQNADGGWGWLRGAKSDALATGMSLYALAKAGGAEGDSAIVRAMRFLIDTQQPDGSWAVPSTKAAKKDRIEETATYWGTAWAVIGLLESLR